MSLRPPSSPPDLSIVVLNWNVRDLLRNCLRSIYAEFESAGIAGEVVVVDSASTDGSAEMVAAEFPQARVVASAENLGYSRGNNEGLRRTEGRHILLLNPDTELRAGALTAMLGHMDAHAGVGVLGPQLLFPDGRPQSSRRRLPTLATAVFESTWLQAYAPRGILEAYYAQDLPDDAVSEVDWLVGAALCVRREAYQQVGGLDESFFMYSEEMDWCRRIQRAGWKVVFFPHAQVIHHVGQSSEQVPAATHIRFQRSKIRYFEKYHGRTTAQLLRLFILASFAVQLALESAKLLLRHRPGLRRQRVEAYWQVLKSGLV